MLKHSLATLAVTAAVLATAGYQHDQTDHEYLAASITDGTSNTVMFGARAADYTWGQGWPAG